MPTTKTNNTNNNSHASRSLSFYIGLTLAGTASSFLTCLHSLFHLQVFLQAYQLPLHVYSFGSTIFAVINTANDVAGAWIVDSLMTTTSSGKKQQQRHEWVGLSGCVFALCFLAPFFRPYTTTTTTQGSNNFWDGSHFVLSQSLYDTLYSFHCILLSSIVTDHSTMTDTDRVLFLAFGKLINMMAPMVVAKIGLSVFDVDNLQPFRHFLIWIALLVCGISLFSQYLLWTPQQQHQYSAYWCCWFNPKIKIDKENDNVDDDHQLLLADSTTPPQEEDPPISKTAAVIKPLQVKQVAKDFISHPNFRYWIVMELLLEAQTTFQKTFMKTFVDQLLLLPNNNTATMRIGLSKSKCDWLLSSHPTILGLASLAMYVPIQRYGYAKMYSFVFVCNMTLSILVLMTVGISLEENDYNNNNTTIYILLVFLLVQPVLMGAMGGAGFGLAMADMVLEMKCHHAAQGRMDEPSLAGLFMGVNALFCKPAESILPIVTAILLGSTDFTDDNSGTTTIQDAALSTSSTTQSSRTVLYRLLVLPPLICSLVQWWVWSKYNLHPQRTQVLRKELESMTSSTSSSGVLSSPSSSSSSKTSTKV